MRRTSPTSGRRGGLVSLATAALVTGVSLLAGAAAAEARTVIFKDGNGASAKVTWDTSGGTLKYYGTVYDKQGDGHHARIFRVNDRTAPRLIAKATSGGHANFGSARKPFTTSLPAHFRVCTYERETSLTCTERFTDATGADGRPPGAYRKRSCSSRWIRQASTQGYGRGFVTSVWPTGQARKRGRNDDVQRQLWSDLQRCIDLAANANYGMDGDQLHMIKLQLDCHAQFGISPNRVTGGPTWDLEASSPKKSYTRLVFNRCH